MERVIYFRTPLYLGEGIDGRKLNKIKKQLCKNPLFANVFLIVPARNPADQLDIFNARQLAQPHYKDISLQVLGIAVTHQEALLLIEQMVCECLEARGDCRLREYLTC